MTQQLTIAEQVKSALQALKDADDGKGSENGENGKNAVVHPADRLFAELLLTRSIGQAAYLQLAERLLRLYRVYLEAFAGMRVPAAGEIEQAVQAALYAGLDELHLSNPPEIPTQPDRVYLAHERIIVEFPYEIVKQQALAPLKEFIHDWDFNRFKGKEWSYPLEAIEVVVQALAPFSSFVFSDQARLLQQRAQRETTYQQELATIEHYWQEFEHQEALKRMQPALEHPTLPDGRTLYAHQREAVERLVTQGRLILAHDMGLGKTAASLVAARAYGRPIFVIAPLSTHIPWLREAEAVDVPIEIYSWAKLPPVPEVNFVLIGDEAHMAQNLATQRTQAFLALAERASATFCVTGTPMKNAQATNLFPLLVACHHPLGRDKRAYENRYCEGYVRKIGRRSIYEATGATNLDELHEKTHDIILYKKKGECLDLPPKIRVLRPAENTPAIEKLYEETIERLWQEHAARMEARNEKARAALVAAEEEGADIDLDLLDAAGGDSTFARALVEMGILRHAASLAKVNEAVAVAEEVREQGGSVVVFSVYRDTARQLALSLHADCLSGDTPAKERQKMIDRFQMGQTTALVCTAAGGLGITLTAAQTVVLVERAWTPGDVVQSEDRLHRIGQLGTVTSVWLQYGPMDGRVDYLLERKQRVIDHVLTGLADVEASGMNRSVLASAREILKSIHEGVPLELLLSQRERELMDQAEAAIAAKATKHIGQSTETPQQAKPRRQAVKRARPGRPRIGGDEAPLRKGFEITLDVETLQRLTARTNNRSAYIERLILDVEDAEKDDPEQLVQMQAKLEERCRHFPSHVSNYIRQIWDTRGVRVALETSEAVALVLDPERTRLP